MTYLEGSLPSKRDGEKEYDEEVSCGEQSYHKPRGARQFSHSFSIKESRICKVIFLIAKSRDRKIAIILCIPLFAF